MARTGVTVRARDIFDIRTYEDRDWAARMASALESPVPATSVGLRMTSYVAQDPDDRGQIHLVLIGDASRLQPGPVTFQVLVRDLAGKKIVAGEQPLGDDRRRHAAVLDQHPVPAARQLYRPRGGHGR